MTILITGASGYVTAAVAADLAHDHAVRLVGRRPPAALGRPVPAGAHFMAGDLAQREDARRAVAGVDAIVHIGADNWISPDTFRNNALSTYYLLEAAAEVGVRRVVFASSNCALGHCARPVGVPFVPQRFPIDEQHPADVTDNYGLSKQVNEQTAAAFARSHQIDTIALRLAWCWGAGELRARLARAHAPDDGVGGFWAYVDMRDVAQAFRKALAAPLPAQAACRAFYINAADTFADLPSAELVERYYPALATSHQLDGHESFFSWRAAEAAFGYRPEYSWRA